MAGKFYLGVDSSRRWGTLGVVTVQGERGEMNFLPCPGGHTTALPAAFHALLDSMNLEPGGICGIGIVRGPGSFTGIRVGISFVMGLSFPGRIPLVPLSSLYALALSCRVEGGEFCAAIDARRGEAYWARFIWKGDGLHQLSPERLSPITEISPLLPVRTMVIGSVGEEILGPGKERGRIRLIRGLEVPRGSAIASYARERIERGPPLQGTVEPLYIRRPDAEVKLERGGRG